jgi:cytochrome c oxidase subunit 3
LTAIPHDYASEEHAPDPVIGHGDPTRPGKIGIWLFLASEIMFFIGILGTYIIYRSGAPKLFARQGETLSKTWAGTNTLVLIFSSLTMAIAVDAAQRGDRKRTVLGLLITLLCAATFMGIKAIEYRDKALHHTIVATADAEVVVKAPAGEMLYATVTSPSRQVYNLKTNSFMPPTSAARRWGEVVVQLKPGGDAGTFSGVVPAGAAGPNKINVYKQSGPEPASRDKTVKPDSVDYGGGVFVFDGHVHTHENAYKFTGWRAPYPADGRSVDVHMLSESELKEFAGAKEVKDVEIDRARINSDTNYGPWKNNFFASYFTLTGVHGLHVLAGMVPLAILLLQSLRGKLFPFHTEYVGLYWHFVDLVWIFLFPLLYLI